MIDIGDALRELNPIKPPSEIAREKLGKISALHEPRTILVKIVGVFDAYREDEVCSECDMPWPCATSNIITA